MSYVKALVAALEHTLQAAGDVRVVRGDAGIRRAIQSKANSHSKRGRKKPSVDSSMVVAAANAVIRGASFRLRMQRSHCVECERIESESPTLLATLAAIVRARLRDDPYFLPRDKKWSYDKYSHVRQRLSYACHASVGDIKQRRLLFPGPSRPLRAVVWLPRPPQEYAWEGPSCAVSPTLQVFAAALGAGFAPSATSRRRAVMHSELPCDLVHEDWGPPTEGLNFVPLDDYDAADIVFFPRPYSGVSSLTSGGHFDPATARSLLPHKHAHQKWVLSSLDAPAPDQPAAFDPRFLARFDLTFGPHPGLFDVATFVNIPASDAWAQSSLDQLWDSKTEFTIARFGETCDSLSRREVYAADLHIAIDHVGACPPHDEASGTLASLARPYKFVLAFETANCVSWVTSDLYEAFAAGAVPVYRGAPDAKTTFVPNRTAVIFADDFASPRALAAHLTRVATDKEAYLSYHAWRNFALDPAFLAMLRQAKRTRPTVDDIVRAHVTWLGDDSGSTN